MIPRHWPDRLRRRVEKHLALRHGGQCRHACFLSPLSSISLITSLRCGVDTSKRPRLRSPKPNGPGGLGAAGASGLTEAVADWLRIAITPQTRKHIRARVSLGCGQTVGIAGLLRFEFPSAHHVSTTQRKAAGRRRSAAGHVMGPEPGGSRRRLEGIPKRPEGISAERGDGGDRAFL